MSKGTKGFQTGKKNPKWKNGISLNEKLYQEIYYREHRKEKLEQSKKNYWLDRKRIKILGRNEKGQFMKEEISGKNHPNWKDGISLKKDYQKQWRFKNPNKSKEYSKKYRETHRIEIKRKKDLRKEETNKYGRKFYKENKARIRTKQKKKERERELRTGGKVYTGIIKRPYPTDNKCEMCGIELVKGLNYHHWDDNDLKKGSRVKGVWICSRCHNFVHFALRNSNFAELFSKYLKLKRKINEEILKKTSNNIQIL